MHWGFFSFSDRRRVGLGEPWYFGWAYMTATGGAWYWLIFRGGTWEVRRVKNFTKRVALVVDLDDAKAAAEVMYQLEGSSN